MIEQAIRLAVEAAVAPLVEEVRKLRDAVERRDSAPALLTTRDAGLLVGRSAAALRMAATRDAQLGSARVGRGRGLRWKRDVLLAAVGG